MDWSSSQTPRVKMNHWVKQRQAVIRVVLSWAVLSLFLLGWGQHANAQPVEPDPFRQFLPLTMGEPTLCRPTGSTFASLPVIPPRTDRPAALHPDLNLALRGYSQTDGVKDYIWIDGPTDPRAPQLSTLLSPPQRPPIQALWQVYDWDWEQNRRGDVITSPEATLIGLSATADEVLHLPLSGYDLGRGYSALVLYAEPHRITLKFTREDNVVWGYTIHLENICVDPGLLALYNALNVGGRANLPALKPGQPFARALASPPGVAIRDNGSFMDPRSIKDWWRSSVGR